MVGIYVPSPSRKSIPDYLCYLFCYGATRGLVHAMNDMEAIEFVFKQWLHVYNVMTERWDKLSISEIDTLCVYQWKAFLQEYEGLIQKPLDLRMLLPTAPINGNTYTTWQNRYTFRDGQWILDDEERIPHD